jgi:hypothetical protein
MKKLILGLTLLASMSAMADVTNCSMKNLEGEVITTYTLTDADGVQTVSQDGEVMVSSTEASDDCELSNVDGNVVMTCIYAEDELSSNKDVVTFVKPEGTFAASTIHEHFEETEPTVYPLDCSTK